MKRLAVLALLLLAGCAPAFNPFYHPHPPPDPTPAPTPAPKPDPLGEVTLTPPPSTVTPDERAGIEMCRARPELCRSPSQRPLALSAMLSLSLPDPLHSLDYAPTEEQCASLLLYDPQDVAAYVVGPAPRHTGDGHELRGEWEEMLRQEEAAARAAQEKCRAVHGG